MKKTIVTLLAATTLAAAFPVFATEVNSTWAGDTPAEATKPADVTPAKPAESTDGKVIPSFVPASEVKPSADKEPVYVEVDVKDKDGNVIGKKAVLSHYVEKTTTPNGAAAAPAGEEKKDEKKPAVAATPTTTKKALPKTSAAK